MYDGHKSHINLTLQEWVKANNIIFYALPPHTSYVTQPPDVGCFGPLKRAYYTKCQLYLRKISGMQLNRYHIAKLSGKAYDKALTPDNLISSFRKSGISPFDPEKTAPSLIYKKNKKNKKNQTHSLKVEK